MQYVTYYTNWTLSLFSSKITDVVAGGVACDNGAAQINEITIINIQPRWRWMTICRYTILAFNQPLQINSAWSSLCW